MSKAIRSSQAEVLSVEERNDSDTMTAKEMLKKFPKKTAKKKVGLFQAIKNSILAKKAKPTKKISKRTNTGPVPSDSAPANANREGKRWIKTLTKQTLADRVVERRHSRKK